jgi:hypothetical protein
MIYGMSHIVKLVALYAALALLFGTGSCVPQPLEVTLKPEEVLPPGFDERIVPKNFLEDLRGRISPTQFWARGFAKTGSWDKTTGHIDGVLFGKGYTLIPIEDVSASAANTFQQIGLKPEHVIRAYDSPQHTMKGFILNMKILREKGADVGTSADYLMMYGLDTYDYGRPEK